MKEMRVTICDLTEVYSNPIMNLVTACCSFDSRIEMETAGRKCNPKNLFSAMKIKLDTDGVVVVKVHGNDEEFAMAQLKRFLIPTEMEKKLEGVI